MPIDLSGRKGYDRVGNLTNPLAEHTRSSTVKVPEGFRTGDEELFAKYRIEFDDWDDQTQDDRDESVIARDYYDGIQWTSEEVDELNEREQPILTKNLIAPKINFVLGSETENRVSPKAYPRTMYHELDAEVVTDGLRAATEMDDFDQTRSSTAKDMAIEGYGGADFEVCCECPDKHYGDCPEPVIRCTHVLWDRLYYDPRSRRHDFSDALFLGIIVWMSRDEAFEQFITTYMIDGYEADGSPIYNDEGKAIASVLEASYARDYTDGDVTQDAPRRWRDSDDRVQFFKTYRKTENEWTVAYWSWAGWIHEPEPVEFLDEKGRTFCPLILASAFADRNNARYGLIKHMISPQDEVNKRASKALHLIHTNRVMAETGAIQSPDKFQAEWSKADGLVEVLPGRLKDNAIQVIENTPLAQAQLLMGDKAEAAINQIGPHAALVASDQRMQSGRMFMARQQAGAMEIKPYFDHLRHWTLRCYKTYWYLIRQYWTGEKWFRIRDDINHQGYRFVAINRTMTRAARAKELMEGGMQPKDAISVVLGPEGAPTFRRAMGIVQQAQQQQAQQMQQAQQIAQQASQQGQPVPPQVQQMLSQPQEAQDPVAMILQMPSMQEEYKDSDVAALDVDIVLDTAPSSPVVRQEQYAELMNLAQTTLPTMTNEEDRNRLLALMFQHSDLRDEAKRQFVESLMPKPPTPEQEQQQAQAMQMQQQQMQLTLAQLQATVAKLQADAEKSKAQAQKASVEAQITVPSAAQLDQAQAAKAMADAELAPHEARLLNQQAIKAYTDTRVAAETAQQQVPEAKESKAPKGE